VDGLITEIELLACELIELEPPDRLTNKLLRIPQVGVQPPRQKTRFGALIRSTIIPGWGQFYSNRSLMGWTMLGSEIAVGALAYMQYSAYQTANDDFIDFQAQYRSSIIPTEIADLKQQAQSSYSDMSTAKDQVTTMVYAVGAIWVANMVHAAITGPKDVAAVEKKSKVHLVYNENLKQPQLRWSIALD